jgi:hypothetical protein
MMGRASILRQAQDERMLFCNHTNPAQAELVEAHALTGELDA